MEDKKLNEQESLALITQMIRNSKNNLGISCGDIFLSWGYPMLIVFVAIYVLIYITQNIYWFYLGAIIPVTAYLLTRRLFEGKKRVKTYVDGVLATIWKTVTGVCLCLTFYTCAFRPEHVFLIVPLYMLVVSIGVSISGAVIQNKSVHESYGLGIVCALAVLYDMEPASILERPFLFMGVLVFTIVLVLIVAGHSINRKMKKANV